MPRATDTAREDGTVDYRVIVNVLVPAETAIRSAILLVHADFACWRLGDAEVFGFKEF